MLVNSTVYSCNHWILFESSFFILFWSLFVIVLLWWLGCITPEILLVMFSQHLISYLVAATSSLLIIYDKLLFTASKVSDNIFLQMSTSSIIVISWYNQPPITRSKKFLSFSLFIKKKFYIKPWKLLRLIQKQIIKITLKISGNFVLNIVENLKSRRKKSFSLYLNFQKKTWIKYK